MRKCSTFIVTGFHICKIAEEVGDMIAKLPPNDLAETA
jgi:hypothetical protein